MQFSKVVHGNLYHLNLITVSLAASGYFESRETETVAQLGTRHDLSLRDSTNGKDLTMIIRLVHTLNPPRYGSSFVWRYQTIGPFHNWMSTMPSYMAPYGGNLYASTTGFY